jgi:hypothetical protein
MRKALRSIIIFWGIVAIFPLISFVYDYFTEGEGAYRFFAVGDGQASIIAWYDRNANGIREDGEGPFPGVCIWTGYRPDIDHPNFVDPCISYSNDVTDEQGKWGRFLPGGSCENYYVFAKAPDGYQPTTDLASNGCSAQFGFVENDATVSHKVLSIDEFTRRKIATLWLTRIAVGLFIVAVAVFGTLWLEKKE